MATGLLEVQGTIDLTRFWPTGSRMQIRRECCCRFPMLFSSARSRGGAFKDTHAFEGAIQYLAIGIVEPE